MVTAQFNFAIGTGGKTRIIAELLKTPYYASKAVYVISSTHEMRLQNESLFPQACCLTALQAVKTNVELSANSVVLIDNLPPHQLATLFISINFSGQEVWTVNQTNPKGSCRLLV